MKLHMIAMLITCMLRLRVEAAPESMPRFDSRGFHLALKPILDTQAKPWTW